MAIGLEQCEKLLAYDGDCPMCTSTIALLVRLNLIKPQQARANYDLDERDAETARTAGIRNQLVVIDPLTREARTGSDALLWILRDTTGNKLWVRVLGLPGFRQLTRWCYQAISYNRRIISPPRHQIVCDCEPEVTVARRLSLVLPLSLLTVLFVGAFGAAVVHAVGLAEAWTGALLAEATVASGLAVLSLAAAALLPSGKRLDYVAQLAVTTFAGALVLAPTAVLILLLQANAAAALASLAALASFGLMFAMQRRRVKALGLSQRWLWCWAMTLASGLGLAVYLAT